MYVQQLHAYVYKIAIANITCMHTLLDTQNYIDDILDLLSDLSSKQLAS